MTTFSRNRESNGLRNAVIEVYDATSGSFITKRTSNNRIGFRSVMRDNFVPGQFFKPGVLNLNPVVHGKIDVSGGEMGFTTYGNYSGIIKPVRRFVGNPLYRISENINAMSYAPPLYNMGMANGSLTRALANLNGPECDLVVNLFEGTQVLRLLANPIRSLAKLGSDFWTIGGYPIKTPNTQKVVKYLSDKWLEYRYGWTPLVSDFYALLDNYDLVSTPKIQGERGKWIVEQSNTVQDYQFTDSDLNYYMRYRRSESVKDTWRSKIYFTVRDRDLFHRMKFGLTGSNLPAAMWEIVPYSFMVDWWFKVGDWLRAVVPNPAVDKLGLCQSVTRVSEIRYVGKTVSGTSLVNPQPLNAFVDYITKGYERWKIAEIPEVWPSFSSSFTSWKHAVDSLALISQEFQPKRGIRI